ncbi:endonuclease domain-containing protein [Miltoncostaea marina]|uniref:endonuclease domain-containing protein n=1 Tax=Miltoncostaea marina TaxID=2843215 RepID=UPI001C3D9274|nr:DUF559 domain-containing protein [Miltoncostaea marina]
MSDGPEQYEVDDKLTEMVHAWEDVERGLVARYSRGIEKNGLPNAIKLAHRVEAEYFEDSWGEPATQYVLMFDVHDSAARLAANSVKAYERVLSDEVRRHVQTWKTHPPFRIQRISRDRSGGGRACSRHFSAPATPELVDAPIPKPIGRGPYIERDDYSLTPIEVPIYEALLETGLTFSVQPFIQGTDRRYRPDFLVFYGGSAVAVELDGHDAHKTKEQRSKDAERDRWLNARGIRTLRWTGSDVHRNPQACVRELMDIVRGSAARP